MVPRRTSISLFKAVLASLRIAFALVCVGLSLLLGAQWFGLVPDRTLYEIEVRRHWAQTAVVSIQGNLQDRQFVRLRRQLRHLAASEPSVISIGLRDRTGYLVASTADHNLVWPVRDDSTSGRDPVTKDSDEASEAPPVLPTVIPIQVGRRTWGAMEVAFAPPPSRLLGGTLDRGIAPLLLFFSVGGMIGYAGLMIRLMNVFRKTQVVPERVRGALDTLTEGVLVLDDGGKILLANDSFANSIGSPAEELVGADACLLRWVQTAEPETSEGKRQADAGKAAENFSPDLLDQSGGGPAIRGGLPIDAFPWMRTLRQRESIVDQRLDLIDSGGQRRNYAINAAPLGDGKSQQGALVTFQDITQRERSRQEQDAAMQQLKANEKLIQEKNAELEVLATRDALTGCLNRRAFFDRTEPMLTDYRIEGRSLSCFMVDVDHFKSVNDTYGHHTGDEVLREVSRVLRELHEPEHLVCRYGGEEFCVVFPRLDTQAAIGKAEQTRLAIAAIRLEEPASLRLTASLGVSGLEFDPADTQGMINQADECLYVAKRGGRNQVVGYDPDRTATLASDDDVDGAGESDHGSSADRLDARPAVAIGGAGGGRPQNHAAIRLPMNLVTPLVAAMTLRDPRLGSRARVHADRCLSVAEGRLEHGIAYRLEIAALLSEFGLIGASQESLARWIESHPLLTGGQADPHRLNRADEDLLRCYHDGQAMVAETFDCPILRRILLGDDASGRLSEQQVEETRLASEILRLAAIDQVPHWAMTLADRSASPIRPETRQLCQSAGWFGATEPTNRPVELPTVPEDDLAWMRQVHGGGGEVTTGIALALGQNVSSQLRSGVAGLAEALDQRDRGSASTIVANLVTLGKAFELHPIVQSASQSQRALADETEDWDAVLRQTRALITLCRRTDNAHLVRQVCHPGND